MNVEDELSLVHQAIKLAEQGHGTAEPNPLVGCIITDRNGVVIGEGFHENFGEEHAEINALNQAGKSAKGGTAYVTLEPCNHQGKTPPCTEALIGSEISRVVIGTKDPHNIASGGIDTLLNAGITVDVLDDALCKELLAPFARKIQTGLPWVTCKWAQTKNGSLETPIGDSPWISSKESQQLVHEERGCIDAIVVGVGTVIADNPSLTARGSTAFRTPIRIVIDPNLRSPKEANIFNSEAPTIIACKKGQDTSSFSHCKIVELPSNNGVLELAPLFQHLVSEFDTTHVMVEGGATLFTHIFEQKLANELWIFVAPTVSNTEPIINMNTICKQLDTDCIHKDICGVDTVLRYKINL
ncbi:MAG: bifunctional diaminohydroxyphosphoribosylaminopyrimidine deaminase/5-amino-6-(5-phosphoribosylamino)uracil reductase RibD [Phycisphaerae bacterium]|nr:bifunctional diaminohydroxyphosphoribosylaminopyrimidine deaminase/5-amino-6-(5-phosphoribosylamino)uracil reductase RibD [Phycisphaerae bacterium]